MTLHAGGTLTGDVRRWSWAITGNYDRMVSRSTSETGVPLGALQASIDGGRRPDGGDRPVDRRAARPEPQPGGVRHDRGQGDRQRPRRPPARGRGDADPSPPDYARIDSDARTNLSLATDAVGRTMRGVISTPMCRSPRRARVRWVSWARCSSARWRGVAVSDFGRLSTSNLAELTPFRAVQLNASVNVAQTAPAVTQLVAPVVATPNVPFFDYVTGRSTLVTTIAGGNPDLAPEKRRVTTLGIAVQPIKDKDYPAERRLCRHADRQPGGLAGRATPGVPARLSDLFVRDTLGQLVSVDLRPVNLAYERERKLRLTVDAQVQLGKAPPPPPPPAPGTDAKAAPPPPSAQAAPLLWLSATTNYRLEAG